MARKWDQLGARPSPALDAAITDAISLAERIMARIDSRSAPPRPPELIHDLGCRISVEIVPRAEHLPKCV